MRKLLPLLLLSIVTAAHASVTATFIDEDGKALPGVRVRIYAREDQRALHARWLTDKPETAALASATTGEDGKVSLDAKGNTVVRFVADAANRAALSIDVVDGEDAGAFVLPAAAPRKGHVRVANVLIAAGPWLLTKSDAQGNFEIPPLVSGFERLYFIHPEFAIYESTVMMLNDTTRRTYEVTLSRGTTIKGRVVNGDKTPAAHATLSVGGWPLAQSGDDGSFTITHAPSNWRVVFANTASDAGAAMNKRGAAVEVKLARAASLSGVVKTATAPVSGAWVALYNELDAANQPSRMTDDKGRFSFDGLIPGHYSIMSAHPAFSIARASLDVPSRSGALIAAEPLVRVRGRAIDEERNAVSGASVSILQQGGGGGFSGPLPQQTIATSPSGEFHVRAHDGSQVQFIASRSGYATGIAGPVTIDKAKDVVITLPKGFLLRVQVLDTEKKPVARASVEISRPAEGPGIRAPLPCNGPREDCRLTKSDGTYEMRIAEGKYDLHITSDDIAPKRISGQALSAKSNPFVVTVDRGVEVSGRVVLADGSPAGGAMVNVRTTASRSVFAESDGTFVIKGLPPGAIALTAQMPQTPSHLQSAPLPVTAPAKGVQLRIPNPATVSGRVIDRATSQPVTDFQVMASQLDVNGSPGLGIQFHSEDGTFTLDSLPGRIELRATAPGYVRAMLTGITVEEGKPVTGVELKLDRGGRIVGHITAAGQPLAGATVSVMGERFIPGTSNAATTDANGDFVLDNVEAGEREVDARKQGYMPKRKSVNATAGSDARADVELERGTDMRGRVVDSGGAAVEGARVEVRPTMGSTPTTTTGRTISDAEGNFKVEGLAEGRYSVVASRDGYVTGMLNDVDVSSANVVVTLERGGTITGRVTGLSPSDLAGMSVMANSGRTNARASVDSDGNFTINGVPDGVSMVTASKYGPPARQSAAKRVTVTNGTASPVEINFAEGATLHGRVLRDGKPMMSGYISFSAIKPSADGSSAGSPITPDGSYQISGLGDGEYRVFINLPGPFGSQYNERLTVSGSATHDFDLRGASFSGRVVDAGSGAPLAEVTLILDPQQPSEIHAMRRTVSDSDGRFLFDLLPEGAYKLNAQRAQYATKQMPVTITAAGAPDADVRLDSVQPTMVRVVDATTGAAVTNANLYVTNSQTKSSVGSNWTRGEDGTMKMWLAPGAYVVRVNAAEYSGQTIDVTVPGPEVRVALQKGASISFHLSTNETYRVRIMAEGKIVRTDYLTAPYKTAVTGIVPGSYIVEVTDATGKVPHGTYPVTLVPGQLAAVDVK